MGAMSDIGDIATYIEPELMGFLPDRVADVAGGEVAADDTGLFPASAQEAAGLVGEIVGRGGSGCVDVVSQVGVQQPVGIQFGAVSGHQVQFDALGVFGEPGPDGFAAVDRVPVGVHVDLAAGVPGEAVEERAENL